MAAISDQLVKVYQHDWSVDSLSWIPHSQSVGAGGDVNVTNFPSSYPVTGSFYPATQPISFVSMPAALGQATAAAGLPVVIASDNSPLSVVAASAFPTTVSGITALSGSGTGIGVGEIGTANLTISATASVCAIYLTNSGAFNGTVRVIGGVNGTLDFIDQVYNAEDHALVTASVPLGKLCFVPCGGLKNISLYVSVYVSGSLDFEIGAGPGTLAIPKGTQPVSIASMPSTPVTGTFYQTTQPISGTVTNVATSTSRTDTFTATGNGVTVSATANPFRGYAIQVVGTGAAVSLWDIRLEGSLDGTNFDQILQHTNVLGDGKVVFSGSLMAPALYFRSRVVSITLGAATQVVVTIVGIQ